MPVVPDPSTDPSTGWAPDLTCCSDWSGYDPAVQARAITLAVGTLWALTGRRFGYTTVTARPCNYPEKLPLYQTYPVNIINPWGTDGGQYYGPYIINGEWHNAGCAGIQCCQYQCGFPLDGPVNSVTQVSIAGTVLTPTAYSVDNGYILRRLDGDCWPFCTDTFLVTYQRGVAVPPILNIAAGLLACEYAKACANQDCALPSRITSLTRQGVSVDFEDPKLFADLGVTQVAEVDRIVALINPHGITEAPVVMSPDTQPIRYQTWP